MYNNESMQTEKTNNKQYYDMNIQMKAVEL